MHYEIRIGWEPCKKSSTTSKRNKVWSLVERQKKNVVGTKWVFHNKHGEFGVVTRNKVRLVAKGYSQVKDLVERQKQNVVGTKWVFHNKHGEFRVVTRNKARNLCTRS
jgi:hypothetical protein